MTTPDDELLARLAAADPIDADTLPTPNTPAAQDLLETIMTTDHRAEAPAETGPDPEVLDLPVVRDIDRFGRAKRNRAGLLATIAAVFVLVTGFVIAAPDNTSPALAAVHSAANATADFDSGRVVTTFDLEAGDGTETGAVSGRLEAAFSGDDLTAVVSVQSADGAADDLSSLPATEGRLVDGVLYTNDDGEWYSLETGTFIGRTAVEVIDPRNVLAEVRELLETTEVGPATIEGVETTQYRSVVDLADESLQDSSWLPAEAIATLSEVEDQIEGEITVDLYIDGDGLLRRLALSGDLVEADGGDGAATLSVITTFSDLGGDISIEAPADATPIDLDEELDLELNPGD